MRVLLYNMCSLTWVSRGNYLIYIGRFSLLIYAFPLLGVSFRMCKKESPTFFGKSPTFFGKSPTFLEKRPRFFEKCPTFFEEVPSIHWQSPRNAREMMPVKEVFKGHKARFYDEMEQNTAKGDKKLQISFWGIWAKNGLYSIILRSLDCKIVLSEIFLRFFCRKSW